MNSELAILRFIDFYLRSSHPKRTVELSKLKLNSKVKRIKDPLLKEVTLIHESIEHLNKKRKASLHLLQRSPNESKLFHALFRLTPKDCLILTSKSNFPIALETLSIALQVPTRTIEFRRSQLESVLKAEGLDLSQLSSVPHQAEQPEGAVQSSFNFRDLSHSFQNLPLALKFILETSAILIGLLALLWVIPEIRNRYEKSIQRRINDYLIESSLVDAPAPEGTSKTPKNLEIASEFDTEDSLIKSSSSDVAPSNRKQPKVNEGETWRFSFTGSATSELESGVVDSLAKQNVAMQKPLVVPGGIQFDFVLPVNSVIPLKTNLEMKVAEIQQKAGTSKVSLISLANFSWYKKKNMGTRKIPSAHVQIIIWISTL